MEIEPQHAPYSEEPQLAAASHEFVGQVLDCLSLQGDLDTLLYTAGMTIGQLIGASRFTIYMLPETLDALEPKSSVE